MAKRVLVTAATVSPGSALVKALLSQPDVERVIGLSGPGNSTPAPSSKFKAYTADIRDEFLLRSILEEENVDTVFHLAFMSPEIREDIIIREYNVGGTLTVLEAANKSSSVKKLVILGSTSAYGARRGNPEFLKEEDPLRAKTQRDGAHRRYIEEEIAKTRPGLRHDLKLILLRCCPILGCSLEAAHPMQKFREMPIALSVLFHKGGAQFITEQDLVQVLLKILDASALNGTYNLAPDDYTTIPEVSRTLKKFRVGVPYSLLWFSLLVGRKIGGRLRLSERMVSSLAYPIAASNQKLKKNLGVEFKKGSLQAFAEWSSGAATVSR